ncbi:DUF4221 family protein [Peijinzhouia sedimentorum]
MSCTSEKGVQDISFAQPDTLVIQTNVNFLTYYDRSYTSTIEEDQIIFYGFNHTRNTIDRINLSTGEIANFKPCDPLVSLYSGSAVGVYGQDIIVQNFRTNYQHFQINKEKNCLKLIAEIDSKSLAGNSIVVNPGLDITISPSIKPAWVNQEFIESFYPFVFDEIPRMVKINPDSKTVRALDVALPDEIKERLRPFTDIAKPLVSAIDDTKVAFIFPFSDLLFTYNLTEKKINFASAPGEFIKGEVELPGENEDLRVWHVRRSNFFHNLIWDPSRRVFYRVEVTYNPNEDLKKPSFFFNRHHISVISENLSLIGQVKVPKNCFSIPIPMGDRLYFMLAQNMEEDAIMFVGIPTPEN